jgi:hypothetical protein
MLHSFLLLLTVAGFTPADSVRPDTDVRQVALHHAAEIQQCYETHGLRVNPDLSGTVEIAATVLGAGRVDSVAITRSNLRGAGRDAVESCITAMVRNWRFERGPYATEIIVYPFDLVRDRGNVRAAGST